MQPVPEVTEGGFFSRCITFGDIQLPVEIQRNQDHLIVEHPSSQVGPKRIREKIRYIFGLDVDTGKALDIIKTDESLSFVHNQLVGIRPYSTDTTFEGLIKTIIQQQISYRAANVLTKKLVLKADEKITVDRKVFYSFPDYEKIVSLGRSVLKDIGLGYKADYILGVCELIQNEEIYPNSLHELSYNELENILKPVRGIGEWTIQTLSIASLHDFSIFPYGDLGIQNVLGRLYNNGTRLTTNEVHMIAEQLGSVGPMVLYLIMCADVLGWFRENSRPKTPKRRPTKK